MFGYDFTPPYLTYHQVDASGSLVRSVPIELPASPMMHDFAITENYVIFMDLPILFQLELAIMGDSFPFRWSDDHTARLGVMPRDGGNDDVRWFEIDPCFIFHVMNAHETDSGGIALEAVRHERLWADGSQGFGGTPLLHRFTIDLDDGSVSQEQLDDRPMEFPQLDKRLTGRAYRFGYGLHLGESESGAPGGVHGVLKLDHDRGEVAVHELHEAEQADEATFVPAGPEAGEDEGYLISYVFDRREDRTHLRIIDASDPAAPALARIKLPTRVPFGFHGIWIPSQTT
jgi:carotenoid cleavage dioxygenase